MADLVKTLTSHLKLVAVGVGAVALFGGTATTISLSDNSTPTGKPSVKPAPHATETEAPDQEDTTDKSGADNKSEPSGVRPTDTHGYCVSHAVAAAKAAGKTGQDIAAAAHSCKKDKSHGKSAAAPGHNK